MKFFKGKLKLKREEKLDMLTGASGRLSLIRYIAYEGRYISYFCILVGAFCLVWSIIKEFEPGLTPSIVLSAIGLGVDLTGKGAKVLQRPFEGNHRPKSKPSVEGK